jgi:hypothetical protein
LEMMRLPFDRVMGTRLPDRRAILSPQAPEAFMMMGALISLICEVSRSRALTPTHLPFSLMISMISWWMKMPPPLRLEVYALSMQSRKGSMEQSGTMIASSRAGFRLGTRSRALDGERTSVSMPTSSQLLRNASR